MNEVAQLMKVLTKKRQDLKLSQKDLEKISHVSQNKICQYEKGKTTPRLDTFLRLTSALGVKITIKDGK